MGEVERILARVADIEVPEPEGGGLRRRVLFYGNHLMASVVRFQPGERWAGVHPEEESVYVVRGRIEYDDGRTLTEGMTTVNRSNQRHPGGATGDEPAILLEITAPPIPGLGPAEGNGE